MVARDPNRPKAAQIKAEELLLAVHAHLVRRGPFPIDALCGTYPKKVIVAKQRKLERAGLLKGWHLTTQGDSKVMEILAS